MKPLLLKMKAFGPYDNEIEIDFSRLPEKGVFLITGDTGAGKTTIFDGIVYALYGSVSGSERKISALRSTYAQSDVMTEVELYFSYKGNEYYIKRSPKQMKLKANPRNDKEYREIPAKAYLSYEVGGEKFHFDKVNEVNNKIDEILGLTEDQFRRIAMIAQGEFQKILISDTNTRTQIFRSIFNTSLYECIQNEIKEDAVSKKQEYEQKLRAMEMTKSNLLHLSYLSYDKALSEKINQNPPAKTQLTIDDCFKLTDYNIEINNKNNFSLKSNRDEIQQKLLDIKKQIETYKEQNRKKRELEKAISDLEQGKIREENAANEIISLKKDEEIRENMERELFSINSDIPLYEQLSSFEMQRLELDNKLTVLREKSAALDVKLENKRKELNGKESSLEAISCGFEDHNRLERLKREYEDELSIFKSLDKYICEYEDIKERCREHTDAYDKCLDEVKKIQFEYDSIEESFIKNQAGIMASMLKDGKPCPVCGSKNHPEPAVFIGEDIDEAKLKTYKELLDRAMEKRNHASEKCKQDIVHLNINRGKIKEILEISLKDKSYEQLDRLSFTDYSDDELFDIKKIIVNIVDRVRISLDEVNKELILLQKAMEERELLQKEIPVIMETISELTKIRNENEVNIKINETTLNELCKNIREKKETLKYENLDKCRIAIGKLEAQIADYDYKLKNALKMAEDARRDTAVSKAVISQLEKDLTDYEEIDIELAEEEKNSCINMLSKLEAEMEECARHVFELENLRDTLIKLDDESNLIYDEYSGLMNLSSVFNGNVPGKRKIMLETYVQMMYFDRILDRANKRLAVMTSGKYVLIRRKDNDERTAKTGLELDVIDIGNGVQRPVDNLSGGEKFEASLALALGLSDEIQERTGGIRLETMFIDEGFGTLDENALKNTLIILEDLSRSNKQIGVISHMAALKEAIGSKIVVTKNKNGTSSLKMQISEC